MQLRFRLFVGVAGLVLLGSANAQLPCWDHEAKGDSQYPEIDSKCVQSTYGEDRATFSAQVPGSQVSVRNDNDPVCVDLPPKVTCRRLCGDLPAGKQPGALGPQGITPGGWSRFEQHLEVFPKGDHYRVCLRLKNWANASLGKGTPKYFSYSVMYAAATPPKSTPEPKNLSSVQSEGNSAAPKELPKSASPLPWVALLGLVATAAGVSMRQRKNRELLPTSGEK
jgi:hypothetical protein